MSLLELFPHPADAFGVVGAGAGHSVGEITAAAGAGVITGEQAMVLVRERGRAMAAAAAVTPTGMTAVLGGDPDEVLAAAEKHGLTAANVNGAGQIVVAGTLEQLEALRRRPAREGARVRPLQVAGAFHTAHMAPAVADARVARRAASTSTTPACASSATPTAPSCTAAARCSPASSPRSATRCAGTSACRPWASSASPACSSSRRPARSSAWSSARCPASRRSR